MARVCKREGFQTKRGIVRNNCYAYSVGVLKLDGDPYKLQPGDLSTGKSFELDTCDEVVERTKEDLKVLKGRAIKFSEKCGRNENKIALILAPGMDYHFLVFHNDVNFLVTCHDETRDSIAKRFDVDIACVQKKKSYKKGSSVMVRGAKCWSHKRGTAFPPTLQDSTGSIIKDPRNATFDYGVLNYTVFCSAFCVKQRDDMKAPIVRSTTNGELNVKKYDRRYTGLKSVIKAVKKRIGMKK